MEKMFDENVAPSDFTRGLFALHLERHVKESWTADFGGESKRFLTLHICT